MCSCAVPLTQDTSNRRLLQDYSKFVQADGGFDFASYLIAKPTASLKSAVTYVIDWLASLWKSATDANLALEWTAPINEDEAGRISDVIAPLGSLASGVASGELPASAVTELGTILSNLASKLDQLDNLNSALPVDQGSSPEIEALEAEIAQITQQADSALVDIADADSGVLLAFTTGEDFVRAVQTVQNSEAAAAGGAGNPNGGSTVASGNGNADSTLASGSSRAAGESAETSLPNGAQGSETSVGPNESEGEVSGGIDTGKASSTGGTETGSEISGSTGGIIETGSVGAGGAIETGSGSTGSIIETGGTGFDNTGGALDTGFGGSTVATGLPAGGER